MLAPLNRLPKVVDATGRQAGGLYSDNVILRRESGMVLKLGLVDGAITSSTNGLVDPYHETVDCSGQEFMTLPPAYSALSCTFGLALLDASPADVTPAAVALDPRRRTT